MPIWWSYPYRQKYPGVWKWCFSLSVMRYNPSVSPAWDEPTSQASQQEEQLWQILDFLLMAFSDISSWRFLPPRLMLNVLFLCLNLKKSAGIALWGPYWGWGVRAGLPIWSVRFLYSACHTLAPLRCGLEHHAIPPCIPTTYVSTCQANIQILARGEKKES